MPELVCLSNEYIDVPTPTPWFERQHFSPSVDGVFVNLLTTEVITQITTLYSLLPPNKLA